MRRPLTFSICALALALAPSVLYAQDPAAAPKPAPTAPKLSFTTDAGLLLVQIKADQTAAFEELIARLRAGAAKTEDATVKAQLSNLKVLFDPATKDAEYELFQLLQKVMTPDELRAPETQEFFKKATGAFAAGYNKLSLTPVK